MSDGKSGVLPSNWAWARVRDTGEYINGLAFKESDWVNEGYPIIRIQNLTNPSRPFNRTTRPVDPLYIVQPGDILVSWSATLDAFVWHGETAVLNQHIFKVVPNDDLVQPRFLFYLLRNAIAAMRESAHLHGSTMKHINRGPFLGFDIPIPPVPEQHRIVAAIEEQFTRLDAAVASLQRARANLKRYRTAVLADAVSGRLVPTEAELARAEGREYEPAREFLRRLHNERQGVVGSVVSKSVVTDELSEGWAKATISQLVAPGGVFIDGDWVESKDQDPSGDVRLIQLADVGDGVYLNRSARFLTSQKARELRCTFLEPGDVLIARMPDPLGRACIFPGDPKQSVTVVDVCIVRTGQLGADHRWLAWTMNSPQVRPTVAAL